MADNMQLTYWAAGMNFSQPFFHSQIEFTAIRKLDLFNHGPLGDGNSTDISLIAPDLFELNLD